MKDMHTLWTWIQSNTQFQFQGGGVKIDMYSPSYGPIQYVIPIQGTPISKRNYWHTLDELGANFMTCYVGG